jgi:hypothetical protein
MDTFKLEGKKAGMDEIIGKPLYSETLKKVIESITK